MKRLVFYKFFFVFCVSVYKPPFFKNAWQTLIGNYQNFSDAFLSRYSL